MLLMKWLQNIESMPYRLLLGALFIASLFQACKAPESGVALPGEAPRPAKNIILLIGDGMALPQISAALYSNNNKLNLEQFSIIGFHKPYSANDLITDSAAGATAFACGVKTYNGSIGMNYDTLPCVTILEELDSQGYATGLVATSTIVHATPAAFISHQPIRVFYEAIAADFLKVDIDLAIGGGKRYFDRREDDDRDLVKELRQKGYFVSDYFKEDLKQVTPTSNRPFIYFTADKHPLTHAAGRDYLPDATNLAISFLRRRSDKGFFLMVEGSQIDWGGHSNDGGLLVDETLDFDRAVGEALRFARRDGETLVLVTGDHESGGLAIDPGSEMNKLKLDFTTNGHTAAMVPVFAYGPSAELFSGIYENTEIYHKMKQALGKTDEATSSAR
ncbi:MAG: alkaline phosphatase [Myxococcales bacterium]|nr:alkaline phosphatase [Myxococcales bacterium]